MLDQDSFAENWVKGNSEAFSMCFSLDVLTKRRKPRVELLKRLILAYIANRAEIIRLKISVCLV